LLSPKLTSPASFSGLPVTQGKVFLSAFNSLVQAAKSKAPAIAPTAT
jgi:hypothetical protein